MPRAKISFRQNRISEFCRRHRIRKLSVFGSAVHEDFSPRCDVDVLVEFEPGHVSGLGFLAGGQTTSMLKRSPVRLSRSRSGRTTWT